MREIEGERAREMRERDRARERGRWRVIEREMRETNER